MRICRPDKFWVSCDATPIDLVGSELLAGCGWLNNLSGPGDIGVRLLTEGLPSVARDDIGTERCPGRSAGHTGVGEAAPGVVFNSLFGEELIFGVKLWPRCCRSDSSRRCSVLSATARNRFRSSRNADKADSSTLVVSARRAASNSSCCCAFSSSWLFCELSVGPWAASEALRNVDIAVLIVDVISSRNAAIDARCASCCA